MTAYRLAEPLPWHAGQHSTALAEFDPPDGCVCGWWDDGTLSRLDTACPVHGRTQR